MQSRMKISYDAIMKKMRIMSDYKWNIENERKLRYPVISGKSKPIIFNYKKLNEITLRYPVISYTSKPIIFDYK
jgi:hypothetical protein